MHPVLQRGRKCGRSPGRQRGYQQRRALNVENRVLLGVTIRQNGSRLGGRQYEIGDDHGDIVPFMQFQPDCARDAARIDRARHDRSEHTGRHVIGMSFDLRRLIQNPQLLPMQSQQLIRDDDPGRQRRGARSRVPFPDGISLSMCSSTGGSVSPTSWRDRERRLPDEIVFGDRDAVRIAARTGDAQSSSLRRNRHSR